MLFKNDYDTTLDNKAIIFNTTASWNPDDDTAESDWDDEDDEDFDDMAADLDDLHEIQIDDDLGVPDPEDDDHLPEEEDEEDE